jgi:hypothetical protein
MPRNEQALNRQTIKVVNGKRVTAFSAQPLQQMVQEIQDIPGEKQPPDRR